MNIIDDNHLLSSEECDLLQSHASKPFNMGGYTSLDDIVTKLNVDVVIEQGIPTRSVPSLLYEALRFWEDRAKCIIKEMEETSEKKKEVLKKELYKVFGIIQFIQGNISSWSRMSLRGLYDPDMNVIKLYPDEMRQEYDGACMDELLVSTLAHETMHAYFNRPGHEFVSVPTAEEPLAELGMLLYLYDTDSVYYDWAHEDVKRKKTCYKYGADIMDQYLMESSPSPTRQFLEAYKIKLEYPVIMGVKSGGIVLCTPKKKGLGVDETPISKVGGSKKAPFPIAPPPFPSHSPMDKGKLYRKTSSKIPSSVLKEPSDTDVVEDTVLCQFIKKVFIYLNENEMIDVLADYIDFKTAKGPKITLSCDSEGKKFNLPGILYLVDCKETDPEFKPKRWFTDSFIIRKKEYNLSSEWNGPEIGSLRFSQFVNMMKSVYPGLFEISFVMKKL